MPRFTRSEVALALAGHRPRLANFLQECTPWLFAGNPSSFAASVSAQPRLKTGLSTTTGLVRLAHQPNFLPSLAVAKQRVTLNRIAQYLESDSCQLVVDYDVQANRRYRHAMFPNRASKRGYISVSPRTEDASSNRALIADEPGASTQEVSKAIERIRSVVITDARMQFRAHPRVVKEIRDRLGEFEQAMLRAYSAKENLPNQNLNTWSLFGGSTVQREESGLKLLPEAAGHMGDLFERRSEIAKAKAVATCRLRDAGLPFRPYSVLEQEWLDYWLVCECGLRLPVRDSVDTCKALCKSCDRTVSFKSRRDFVSLAQASRVIPKIIIDDLLDAFCWGFTCGVAYAGAIIHHLFAATVAEQLNIPMMPEYFTDMSSEAAGPLLGTKPLVAPSLRVGQVSAAFAWIWYGGAVVARLDDALVSPAGWASHEALAQGLKAPNLRW